ncbi:MAG: glyxoylase [Acidobacteriia bacterium 12-62-4]|nr:MAG: glyxoylase [Acidobacteriia bacterium 12-62-4]
MTPLVYLTVKGAAEAIAFYERAFGAKERYRLVGPDGKIGHAELALGTSVVMLSDEYPDFGALSPHTVGGCPMKMHLVVADAEAAVARAVEAGAMLIRPVKAEFYGEKTGMVTDPFGFSWFLAEVVEQVTPEEMQRRWDAMMGGS